MLNPEIAAKSCTVAFDIDDQKYLFISDSFFDFFGIAAASLNRNGDFLDGLLEPATHESIRQLSQNLDKSQSLCLNYKLINPAGPYKYMAEKRSLVIDALSGHRVLLSVITADEAAAPANETAREVMLREQFLNSLIDSQTNFLIRIDINGNFSFVNRQFLKTFGYTTAEIIGHHFSETTIPQEVYLCEEAFINCISNPGKVIKLVHKKPDKNGFLHDTEWEFISIVDDSGQALEIQGIGQDITPQNQAREEILQVKKSLEALINNTQDHIWSVDSQRRYLYMNQAYISQMTYLTGIEPKMGQYSYKHAGFSKQIIDEWNVYYQRALSGERYSIINESADPVSSRRLYFEVSFNPIYTAEGHIIGVGCFAHNITNRLKIQQELIDQNQRLRNIASLSSHELRRPVASMMGLISIMDHENFFNPENEQIIGHLLTVSTEIDDVIRLIVDSTFTK